MKVLHVCRPVAGGIRTHLTTLMPHLGNCGVSCALAAPSLTFETINIPDVRRYILPINDRASVLADVRCALYLYRIVSSFKPDIVHSHGYRAGYISALSAFKGKRVLTCHNLLTSDASYMSKAATKFSLKRSNRIIAVSEAVALSLASIGVATKSVKIIPNGINAKAPLAEEAILSFRLSHYIPPGMQLVSCIARLMSDKGVDTLIEAWKSIAEKHPDAVCLIAGDGPLRPTLEDKAKNLPTLRFIGETREVDAMLAASHVVVIPSRREGQSFVCLEAMASSPAPAVVATNVGGLKEMIIHEHSGLLTEPDNPRSLATQISRALENPEFRLKLTENASLTVNEKYSALTMVSRVLEVYSSL